MKYIFIFILFLGNAINLVAQEQTAALLQETAKSLVQKGDYENAVMILEKAKLQEPNNISILKDLSFANHLKRDFAKAIEVGNELIGKSDADEQSYQILGLSYKAIASYKDCGKMYKVALRKFPNSGVIYNEYAELFALESDLEEAINQWEKGISVDPNYSSNYFNAAMYYGRKNNWLRAIIYAEMFLNLESYSTRTEEMKAEIITDFKNLLNPGAISTLQNAKTTTAFEKTFLEGMAKFSSINKVSIDDIISIRTKCLLEWVQGKQKQYPFRLFEHQQYLLSQGLFEAYNYWLFNTPASEEAYKIWQKNHSKEEGGFKEFQQSRVFKIPFGEYYFAH